MTDVNDRAPTPSITVKGFFDHSGKAIAVVIGTSYVMGLFIVNYHLGMYGVRPSGLLRADYVLAGGTWLFLFVLTALVWRDLVLLSRREVTLAGKLFVVATRLPIYLFVVTFAVVVIAAPGFRLDTYEAIVAIGVVALVPIILAYPTTVAIAIVRLLVGKDTQDTEPPVFALPFAVLLLVLALALYSNATYPIISPAYGAGARCPLS